MRALTNEAELHKALIQAVPYTHRVELDHMPLVEQMKLVSKATTLVAVFGQALTWMILQEDQNPAAAVLELAPKEAYWKRDYQILAGVLGLRFQRMYGKLSACLPQPPIKVRWQQRLAEFNKWLFCNVTVDVEAVARAAKAMEAGCAEKCERLA